MFKVEEANETANGGGVTTEGARRRVEAKMLKIEGDFFGSNLLKERVFGYKFRLSGEPGEEAIKVGYVVLNGY